MEENNVGLSSNNSAITTLKKCSKCKRKKGLHLFSKHKSTKDGLSAYCKKCNINSSNLYRKSIKGAAASCLTSMKRRAKKKGFSPPEFTIEEIVDKIENGKCEVTGRSFDIAFESKYRQNPFQISPDRIDSFKGYTKKNVRWVMSWINIATGQYDLEDFKKWIKGVKW